MSDTPTYEFTCEPILNAFGAETDTRATLYRDGVKVKSKRFFFKRRAVNQCLEWKELYGAVGTSGSDQ